MNEVKLDEEEKVLLADYEAGKFESVLTASRKEQIREIATNMFKKDKQINVHISNRDFEAIQRRALVEGISYQTLISSILHKYASGSLYDVVANKPVRRTIDNN